MDHAPTLRLASLPRLVATDTTRRLARALVPATGTPEAGAPLAVPVLASVFEQREPLTLYARRFIVLADGQGGARIAPYSETAPAYQPAAADAMLRVDIEDGAWDAFEDLHYRRFWHPPSPPNTSTWIFFGREGVLMGPHPEDFAEYARAATWPASTLPSGEDGLLPMAILYGTDPAHARLPAQAALPAVAALARTLWPVPGPDGAPLPYHIPPEGV